MTKDRPTENLYNKIRRQMLIHPQTKIKEGDRCLSYFDFLCEVEQLAEELSQRGINGQKCVLLCRSELNNAIAVMACFKAQITAVPTTTIYGEKYSSEIITACKPNLIIREDEIPGDMIIEKCEKTENRDSFVGVEEILCDVALIMYTSGTGGAPKGVMLTYDNIQSNLSDINEYFEITCGDCILILRPLFHVAALTGEFLISLLKGLDIVFFNDKFEPIKAVKMIKAENISVLCATPTILFYMLNWLKNAEITPLRVIVSSGECMTETVADKLIELLPDVCVYNVYGMTEASPRIAYLDYRLFKEYRTSVGVPLKSVKCKVLDGELLIQGPNVMKGYYKQGNSSYVSVGYDDGWLRTGDAAEIEDGIITIRGRIDHMIIKGGMNVYPQEIENVFRDETDVLEVQVSGIKAQGIGDKILLRVVLSNRLIEKRDIFQICKRKLPSYLMPDVIEIVESIEKSAAGKIVRRK